MPDSRKLWMRHETRATERRAPIVPEDARHLVDSGIEMTVEASPQRVFAIEEYEAAGCRTVEAGAWANASDDCYVVGLKELPDLPTKIRQQHVYFGHAYKGQEGAPQLLRRFRAGGGVLLDLEYLVDAGGRRLAAFGYWAGYVGAALAVLHRRGRLAEPLRPLAKSEWDDALRPISGDDDTSALVIGALGRSGRGACDAFAVAGIDPTCWDMEETRQLDRAALLDHDVLVNTVLTTRPIPPFLTQAEVADPARRLALVSDVTCDVGSPCNVLPIYDSLTSWRQPVRRLAGDPPMDIIAIDNLPSLLPREASIAFSAELRPHLMSLGSTAATWQHCVETFRQACATTAIEEETADA